uniref:Alkaline phosphatase n=1 Tax=Anguilla anguilla TaxID=7936 RepID=A0A0E9QMH6_ANGAN
MAKRPTWSLLVISLLAVTALSQDLDLFDALDDGPTKSPPAKPKPAPAGPAGGKGLSFLVFLCDGAGVSNTVLYSMCAVR